MQHRHLASLRASAALVLLLGSAAQGPAAIDFNPRYTDIMADGVSMHTLCLQDDAQQILLKQPPGWDVRGEAGALCLTCHEHDTARIDLRSSAVKLPPTPDDAWIKSMTPALLKSLPEGAKHATMATTVPNPFTLFNWKSFEFQMTYELAEVRYTRSVCFLTVFKKGNIEMLSAGQDQDFAAARATGLKFLRSWYEPPADTLKKMVE